MTCRHSLIVSLCALLPVGCGVDASRSFRSDYTPPLSLGGLAERVVVLIYDGARLEETFGDQTTWGEGWSDAWNGETREILPTIRSTLYSEGSLVKPAYNAGATLTVPAHYCLLVGRRAPIGHFAGATGPGWARYDYPTIFEMLGRDYGISSDRLVFTSASNILHGTDYGVMPGFGETYGGVFDYVEPPENEQMAPDPELIENARAHLEAGAMLVWANLKVIDDTGHVQPDQYAMRIHEVDEATVDLWDWIQSQDALADRTALIIVADHGRHRFEEETYPWRDHGDHCTGCREIPMFLMGPGIRKGVELLGHYTQEDLTRTIAWILGMDLPYSDGLVMTGLFEDEASPPVRSGYTRVSAAGGLIAAQDWLDDVEQRSAVRVNGQLVDAPSSFAAEEPGIASGDESDFVCWRTLHMATGDETESPWTEACYRGQNGRWTAIGFPTERVHPFFSPGMVVDESDRLWTSEMENEDLTNAKATRMVLRRWSEELGWTEAIAPMAEGFHLVFSSLQVQGDEAWVAYPYASDAARGREERRVMLIHVTWPEDENPQWSNVLSTEANADDGTTWPRAEYPALLRLDGYLHLAWVGYGEEGTEVLYTTQGDANTWSVPARLDGSGRVFSNVRPRWSSSGSLFWAHLGDHDTLQVCRRRAGVRWNSCTDVDHAYIDSIAPINDNLVKASVSDGMGSWELISISFAN